MQFLKAILSKVRSRGKKESKNSTVDYLGKNSVMNGIVEYRNPSGTIRIGNDCTINGFYALNTETSVISIGDNVSIGGSTIFECADTIEIGSDVLISYQCILQDSNNHSLKLSERKNDNLKWNRSKKNDWKIASTKPVRIGRGCWLGARCIVLKGVTLGEGVIVGAGSVVTKSFPAWVIIGGNPAKIIREIPESER